MALCRDHGCDLHLASRVGGLPLRMLLPFAYGCSPAYECYLDTPSLPDGQLTAKEQTSPARPKGKRHKHEGRSLFGFA